MEQSARQYDNLSKVGIVTLPGLFNYGNRLQAYAVQYLLAQRGWHPVTIETTDVRLRRMAKHALYRMIGRPATVEDRMTQERYSAFRCFNERINTLQTRIGSIDSDDYALFISGSDQVWNPNFMQYRHPEMLPFAVPEKRVALAASVGVSQIEARDRGWFAREVGAFAHISVRELRAAEIVRELTGREAAVLIDPTLAVDADHWRSLAADALTPAGPYVFTYLLGGVGFHARGALNAVCRGGTPVVPLTDRDKLGEPPAGPAEFISLVANASHVVTDSFHASAFSLLMDKPLTIVRREGDTTMFSRLESFAETFGLEKYIYEGGSFSPMQPDYAHSLERLATERHLLSSFLDGCLPVRS